MGVLPDPLEKPASNLKCVLGAPRKRDAGKSVMGAWEMEAQETSGHTSMVLFHVSSQRILVKSS